MKMFKDKYKETIKREREFFYSQVTSRNWSDLQSGKYLNAERIMCRISEVIAKNLSSKPVSEATWKNLVNTSSVITGPGADVIANRIPVDEREYKGFGFSYSGEITTPAGGVIAGSNVVLTIDDDTKEAYISGVISIGAGVSLKTSIGKNITWIYFPNVNNPEDLTGASIGGVLDFGVVSIGGNLDLINRKLDSIEVSPNISNWKETFKKINIQGNISFGKKIEAIKVSSKEIESILKIQEKQKEVERQLKFEENPSQRIKVITEKNRLKIEEQEEAKKIIYKYGTFKEKIFNDKLLKHRNETIFWEE